MAPSVTAAMIVRDEAGWLPGCLGSLEGHVDEIVIVDTGSRDDSMDLARRAGARVLEAPWAGDFAAARNHGLSACRTDWILYIDADERLRLPDGARLTAGLAPDWIAAFLRFQPKAGYTRYLDPRLFRRHPRLRFAGRIHETVYPALCAMVADDGTVIGRSPAMIDHRGYDGDQAAKHRRNLPLLERAVEDTPGRVYLWYHLAETREAMGLGSAARAAARRGLAAAAEAPDDRTRGDASLIRQYLARTMLDQGEDPLDLIRDGLARMPDDHALTYLLARRHLAHGRPEEALALADSLLARDPDALPDGFLAYDRELFGTGARRLKARALLMMGRAEAAFAEVSAAGA